ncbi:hypothetical protein HDG34_003354 [Paraburkholderia sp. HC6.4b]|uniref:DUF7941 domain-family protein n=1 Tax=unclassified Paraburkholderia TaxID=2615204 RepID=UPI001614987A|nr:MULTISPECIES: hypothetical protein [unclassified Paraburkholderia]MBB5409413.1 hypothetical protein [Paraburkholderia sp. HC6.4b]MBB5451142.1 hypothetical protein [Paraburkholderia sp. Kb1A]
MSTLAPLVLDFTQPARDVLLAQINHDNATAITPDQIRMGYVGALGLTDPSGKNTTVHVAAAQGANFEGTGYFNYDRIDIGTVPGARSTLFTVVAQQKRSDLLPDINARFSLNLTRPDIVDAPLPAVAPGETLDVSLVMSARALLWTGSLVLVMTR